MQLAEQFELNGYTVKIYHDEDAESPEGISDDAERRVCFLATTRNRYFEVRADGFNPEDMSDEDRRAEIEQSHHVYPLYAYIHGGVALSLGQAGQFSDQWDSGQIGHVFITRDTGEITHPDECAEGLVETWNQYLSGDVYGYVIEDGEGAQVDSCWGFYGMECCKEEARACVPDNAPLPLTLNGHAFAGAGI